ncbi:integrase arm-type DNA-binding domain-containing protein [Vibrio parahaemolyticus]|nr:integrase arm-type DNA-binding domain-containing protein [Vibrio parahaemolyticus]
MSLQIVILVPHLVPHHINLLYNGLQAITSKIIGNGKNESLIQQSKHSVIKDKEYTFTVEEGLQLRIRPKRSDKGTGTKAWQFKYRHPVTRKITKISMGTYPSLRLAAAKLEAAEYRKQIAEGIDPKRSKENKRIEELRKHNDSFQKFQPCGLIGSVSQSAHFMQSESGEHWKSTYLIT